MRRTAVTSFIQILGIGWYGQICAMDKDLSLYDIGNIEERGDGEITREAVEDWLTVNSGDFQSVTDFRADISYEDEDYLFEWSDEDSGWQYNDCFLGYD
jgi:hypothetical protein